MKVGFLPKDIVNTYFAAAKLGVDKAAKVDGSTVIQLGPNEAKADLQVPFIADADNPEGRRDPHLGRRQG